MTIQSNDLSGDEADFRIRFHDCDAGWIHMDLAFGDFNVTINLSHIYEPLPSMLAWLESVVIGVEESSFEIDEEGSSVKFISRQIGNGVVQFKVVPSYEGDALDIEIPRRQLISAIYCSFVEFSESSEYKSREWERRTLADALQERGGLSPLQWMDSIVDLDRRGIQKAVWLLDQTRYVDNDAARSTQIFATPAEILELTGSSADNDSLLIFWPFEDWESVASRTERLKILEECLSERVSSSWDGCPWGSMRSSLIESWLASSDEVNNLFWQKWLVPNRSSTLVFE